MDLAEALSWAADRRLAALVTVRRDGRPQSSTVSYGLDGGTFVVSITDDRAKTANMRRDPRVLLHVYDGWSYVAFDGTASLSPVTITHDDETSDALVAYYESVAGPHPDWGEYRVAMIAERRLVARIEPSGAVGVIR